MSGQLAIYIKLTLHSHVLEHCNIVSTGSRKVHVLGHGVYTCGDGGYKQVSEPDRTQVSVHSLKKGRFDAELIHVQMVSTHD